MKNPCSSFCRRRVVPLTLVSAVAISAGCYEEVAYQPADSPASTQGASGDEAVEGDTPATDDPQPPANSATAAPASDELTIEPAPEMAPSLTELPPLELEASDAAADDSFADALGDPAANDLPAEEEPTGDSRADSISAAPAIDDAGPSPPLADEVDESPPLDLFDVPAAGDTQPATACVDAPPPAEGEEPAVAPLVDAAAPTTDAARDVPATLASASQAATPSEAATVAPPIVAAEPTVVQRQNTRQVAWLLASKLSYALLAPLEAAERDQLTSEAQQLADALDIEAPMITQAKPAPAAVLAYGRTLGEQLAPRGAEHAALVEVAFKTNLLLAVYAEQPELVHPIVGAVAAAAVRAGVPDTQWKAWQQDVLTAADAAAVHAATDKLHTSIARMLAESAP